MATNSAAMTLEERVVQKLKDDTLYMLVGDEDAILELATRAVKEALFADRLIPSGTAWGSPTKGPSPAVEAATKIAEKAATIIIEKEVDRLFKNEEFVTALRTAIANALPKAIEGYIRGHIVAVQDQAAMATMLRVQDYIRNAVPGMK